MAGSRHLASHVNAAAALRSVMLSALHNGRDKVTGAALTRGGHFDTGEAMQMKKPAFHWLHTHGHHPCSIHAFIKHLQH